MVLLNATDVKEVRSGDETNFISRGLMNTVT
jgi:hypothetical protein